jgi:hypothetical protein
MRHRLEVPVATKSLSNQREHWAVRAKRTKLERRITRWTAMQYDMRALRVPLPATVTLVRRAPRALDDDNLRGALKAVRDEVAMLLGLSDDRDPRVRWDYGQEKGKPAAVVVTIEAMAEASS